MVKEVHVEGYDAAKQTIEANKDKTLFVLFSASAGADGKSWCPDCVVADPVIKECLKSADADAVLVHCGVGGIPYWKNQSNDFRMDSQMKLKSVPTLMRWGKPQRLEESQCADKSLVEMMFSDE